MALQKSKAHITKHILLCDIASIEEGRQFIGYEFNEGFKDLMIERFTKEKVARYVLFKDRPCVSISEDLQFQENTLL